MVSLGILAVALLAIGDINGGAVRMHAYARQLTVAVQLARGKMLDVQQLLQEEGLSDYSKEYKGDFSDEGFREFRWVAQVIKPELEIDATRLLEMASSALMPPARPGEPVMDNPLTSGPLAGLAATQLQQVIETIKTSVREVKLTIHWKNGRREESFDLVEHLVILPDAKAREAVDDTPQPQDAGPSTGDPANPGSPPPTVGGGR